MTTSVRYIFVHVFFISIIGFVGSMTFLTIERGSLKKHELKAVNGKIKETWMFVHKSGPNRNGFYKYDTIQAFKVVGHNASFGISENRDFFYDFTQMVESNQIVDISLTYNPKGEKIEQATTLHIFSFTANSDQFLTLEETKRSEMRGTFVFGSLMFIRIDVDDLKLQF